MPKKKVPDIPEEYPHPKETPQKMPGQNPEIEPIPVEKPVEVPVENPEPVIPDEQPGIPPEIQ